MSTQELNNTPLNKALWNFGHSDQVLWVPTIISGSWIDSRDNYALITENWRVDLSFNWCDRQNPEIFS